MIKSVGTLLMFVLLLLIPEQQSSYKKPNVEMQVIEPLRNKGGIFMEKSPIPPIIIKPEM